MFTAIMGCPVLKSMTSPLKVIFFSLEGLYLSPMSYTLFSEVACTAVSIAWLLPSAVRLSFCQKEGSEVSSSTDGRTKMRSLSTVTR